MRSVVASMAISGLIAIFLGEAIVRFYGTRNIVYDIEMTKYANLLKVSAPAKGFAHIHAPSTELKLMGVNVKINSDGLRDREYDPFKKQERRYIFLGDSILFGWGVEKEKTFEEILERNLSQAALVEVINLGVGNYNTSQAVSFFKEVGLKYSPDEVVLFYFINDAEETPKKTHWSIMSRSQLITFLWSRINMISSRFFEGRNYRSYYQSLYQEDSIGWARTKSAIERLRDMSREHGFLLKVVIVPELHQLAGCPFEEQMSKVKDLLMNLDVAFKDLCPSFPKVADPTSLWVASDDAHPNELGHRIIADLSFDFVRSR